MSFSKNDNKNIYAELWANTVPKFMNYLVPVLAWLIGFISWGTCKGSDFLENPVYMTYQLISSFF